uniref:Uncharacterized protein n=1 Tax=Chromera velia CCMP2878 TaxID=1169474 RepID=A0A0G4G2T0_9ALVE|eukprot:Cvel_4087.t1-p1 / transcript=Cvel_4087.t1 / gene=Cvel_4087 / organism=Chromera_velia_CCMP2878 / gene_product=hypothetical protein / transcript_product=hypothetical protein / location=Cvel_scaffold174:26048-28158(-) / protein_length=248 / sequence_SO=supercontig / SO=protein_coding / is_pseudo=false
MNKCRDKAAGKPRVPPPRQSGSPPPQQQQQQQQQQQSSGSGSQSSGSSGSGQQDQNATGMSPDSFVFGSEAARSISLISVGDRVVVTDPRPLPSSGLPVRGKEGIFCGVESESCMMVIVKTENRRGWKPLRMHPSGVSLIEWYGLNASPDLTEFEGAAAAPADDVDRFSDFSFDDNGEVDANAMGGADPVAVLSSSRAQATFFDRLSTVAVRQLEHVVGSQPASVSTPFSLPFQGAADLRLPAGQLEA